MNALMTYLIAMVNMTITVYIWIMFVYIISSWFVRNRYAKWYVFLGELVEPALNWIRRVTRNKLNFGGLDLSPLLLFFGLTLIQRLLAYL